MQLILGIWDGMSHILHVSRSNILYFSRCYSAKWPTLKNLLIQIRILIPMSTLLARFPHPLFTFLSSSCSPPQDNIVRNSCVRPNRYIWRMKLSQHFTEMPPNAEHHTKKENERKQHFVCKKKEMELKCLLIETFHFMKCKNIFDKKSKRETFNIQDIKACELQSQLGQIYSFAKRVRWSGFKRHPLSHHCSIFCVS